MKEFIIFVCTDSAEIFFSKLRSAGLNYNLPSFLLIDFFHSVWFQCNLREEEVERLNGKVKQLQQEIRNLNGEIEDKEQKVRLLPYTFDLKTAWIMLVLQL